MSTVAWWVEWVAWTAAALCVALAPVWPGGEVEQPRPPREPDCQCLLVVDVQPTRLVLA